MCDRARQGAEGAEGVGENSSWGDLKPILWGLKLEDYRTNILCENCARVRRCHCFCQRERDVYCPRRSSAPVRITKGWHKFTSSLSPSNKTVTVKLCAPVSMKQPVRSPILVPGNGKEQKENKKSTVSIHLIHTHKHAHIGPNFVQVISEKMQTKLVPGLQSHQTIPLMN